QEWLVVAADHALGESGVQERRERIAELEAHGSAALGDLPRRRHPLPGRLVARGEVPARRDVGLPAPRLGDHLVADQEAELDADAGEADSLSARLGARGDVVVTRQLAALHPRAVV